MYKLLRAIEYRFYLPRFLWYRQYIGGTWYYNRLWFDLGRGMITYWSRNCLGYNGGNACTLTEETYGKEEKLTL